MTEVGGQAEHIAERKSQCVYGELHESWGLSPDDAVTQKAGVIDSIKSGWTTVGLRSDRRYNLLNVWPCFAKVWKAKQLVRSIDACAGRLDFWIYATQSTAMTLYEPEPVDGETPYLTSCIG